MIIEGIIAIKAKKIDPGRTILFNTLVKYSSTLLTGTPGIVPPFSLIFFAISTGFKVT